MRRRRQVKVNPILNRSQIAKRMGVSHTYVIQLLHGKRKTESRRKQIKDIVREELRGLFEETE